VTAHASPFLGAAGHANARPFVKRFATLLAWTDAFTITASIALTVAAAFAIGSWTVWTASEQTATILLLVTWPFSLWRSQAYSSTTFGRGFEEYRRVLVASGWAGLLALAFAYLTGATQAKGFLLITWAVGTAALMVERNIMRRVLHRTMDRGHSLHQVYVIASEGRERQISETLRADGRRFHRVGSWHLCDDSAPDPQAVITEARARGADTIIYAPLGTDDTQWTKRLGWAMEDTDLSLLVTPSLSDIAGPRLWVEPVEELAFVRVDMPRFTGPARVAKRAFDIVGSAVALAILGVPLLIIAVLIRRDSPGPALFKQTRAGIRSSTFTCWKFRTMLTDADAQRAQLRLEAARLEQEGGQTHAIPAGGAASAATFKMTNDPRVTRVGRFLRRYSLDELPQLMNVLRGEMSLVGPRPHPLDDVERYDDVATRRLLAKPGMTGLWQVSGRSNLDWSKTVRLDLYYVENWSLTADLMILLRTLKVVVAGTGAY